MATASPTPHPDSRSEPTLDRRAGSDAAWRHGAAWPGTNRYDIVRELGRGGMGVVYEAVDRERGQSVALKTLHHFDAAGLYRFKQEFRTLSDIGHPGLVRLYELVVNGAEGVFFTMELIRGTDFLRHVQKVPAEGACAADLDRLRPALRQLAEAVQALHAGGQVHRDLKPSNVIVAGDGRVVVLDLGVATSLRRAVGDRQADEGEMVGTATYMAPEQAMIEAPTPAADWYSVGVVLYEALVGRPPIEGTSIDVLARKNLVEVVPPSRRVEGVPPDLDALCVELLHRDPRTRPTGPDVLRRLHPTPSARPIPSLIPLADPTRALELVGRAGELAALRDAFDRVVAGSSVSVRLGGESGLGKSAIATHFLDGLVERGEALVLRGRAYERESLPYKAVDGVVDEVSRYLARAEERDEAIDLPADVVALARVFPVLRRVPTIARAAAADLAAVPRELRSRAFGALRALLTSLGERQPLVVYIDDAQWGDADSASLVLALMRPPDAPRLLLLMTYRSHEAASSAFLNGLRDGWPGDAEERELPVGPLSHDESEALARTLVVGTDELAQRTSRALARESRGNPFLLQELARSDRALRARPDGETLKAPTLEEMVSQRLERLSDGARRLVELVAVAGRPVPVSVIAEASGVGVAVEEAIATVRARRFVHTGWRDGQGVIETSHGRFRETILAQLSDETLRDHHRRLASALDAVPDADPEAIALHLVGAGEDVRAAQYAERAAEHAEEKLAFDHAARLYGMALEAHGAAGDLATTKRLLARQGVALGFAGRASAAVEVYRRVAASATGQERVEIEQAIAEQLFACGRVDEGGVALRNVLSAMGMSAPTSALGAVFWLIVYRVRIALLGARGAGGGMRDVSREDRVRIDALYAVTVGIGMVDVILGACMQARHTLVALTRGDRIQVLRAIGMQLVHIAVENKSEGGPKEAALLARAQRLAADEGAFGDAYLERTQTVALYLRCHFAETIAAFDAAPPWTRRTVGDSNAELFVCFSLYWTGRLREQGIRARRMLREAEELGDLYTSVTLRLTVMVDQSLRADDAASARRHLHEGLALWSQSGFSLQHWYAMFWEAQVDLYEGNPLRAWQRLERDARPMKRSFLLHSATLRVLTAWFSGCCAAGAASLVAPGAGRDELIRAIARSVRTLEKSNVRTAPSYASLLRAATANLDGRRDEAVLHLREGIVLATQAGMALHVAGARIRLGQLLGGAEGEAACNEGVETMLGQGIRAPERWVGVALPGTWGS